MPRASRTVRNVLSLALLLGLAAGAAWLIAQSRPRPPDTVGVALAPFSAAPSQQSPLPTPTQPPSAPLAPSPTPEQSTSASALYIFGEPRVVFTSQSPIGVADWLPDNKTVLLVRYDPSHPGFEWVETLNINTGELLRFGERQYTDIKPIWLEAPGRVAFTGFAGGHQANLWIVGPDTPQPASPSLENVILSLAGRDDSVLAFLRGGTHPVLTDGTGQVRETVPINLRSYGLEPDNELDWFRMSWHPSKPAVAIYDTSHFLTLNVREGQVRQFDLGEETSERWGYGPRWAFNVLWSPTGDSIALIIGVGQPPFKSTRLFVLDITTGEARHISLPVTWVRDLAWAPDGQQILVGTLNAGQEFDNVYLVDVASGEAQLLKPLSDKSHGGLPGWNLAWSPAGDKLILRCAPPSDASDALCAVSVSIKSGAKP